jgi:hypothetical protein
VDKKVENEVTNPTPQLTRIPFKNYDQPAEPKKARKKIFSKKKNLLGVAF